MVIEVIVVIVVSVVTLRIFFIGIFQRMPVTTSISSRTISSTLETKADLMGVAMFAQAFL